MTSTSLRRLRYAPETAVVEIALAVAERVADALLAEHPCLRTHEPCASTEARLAGALLRSSERFRRAARRYSDYVDDLAEGDVARVDPRQIEMF